MYYKNLELWGAKGSLGNSSQVNGSLEKAGEPLGFFPSDLLFLLTLYGSFFMFPKPRKFS